MSKAKPDAKDTLSPLGKRMERVLTTQLDIIEKDMKVKGEKYSLTDLMKVADRVIKLEAIKSKANDEEGAFFTQPGDEDES